MMNGKGKITIPEFKYDGDMHDDKMQGVGEIIFTDERKYTGEFINNRFEGQGTFTWPKGLQY